MESLPHILLVVHDQIHVQLNHLKIVNNKQRNPHVLN